MEILLHKSSLQSLVELPSLDKVTSILRKCRKTKSKAYANRLHAFVSNNGLEAHKAVGNYIITMLVECGSMLHAQSAFNRLVHRDEHSWTSMMLGSIQIGEPQHAFGLYKNMHEDRIHPSRFTIMALLKASSRLKDIQRGREVHVEIIQKCFERDLCVGNTLVDMYTKCGSFLEARKVFDSLPFRSVVSWNALISGYTNYGFAHEALLCFEQMQFEGLSPDCVTFVGILKACTRIGAIDKGHQLHKVILRKGFESDIFIGNTLIDMYAKCRLLSEAWEVFNRLPVRNVVSWNALITGYAEYGSAQEALVFFKQMQQAGIAPDAVTYMCILKACGTSGAISTGREIHREITRNGFVRDLSVGNTLVDMYAKCGSLAEAKEVFDVLPIQDVVSWTALISGYVDHGFGQEALKCFEGMQVKGVSANIVTFVCCLKACGNIGAVEKGREIHFEIRKQRLERDICITCSLVDMYAKCGSLSDAWNAFERFSVRDIALYNAMINGYGINNEVNLAIQCFEHMQAQGLKPNSTTFSCLLTACSRATLVCKGQEYYNMMRGIYGILPLTEQYTCMVDLLARAGCLYDAEKFLDSVSTSASIEPWTALLTACKTYGEEKLGLRCFQQLVQINPEYSASYVLMANIYANSGSRDDAYRIEKLRKLAGAKKNPAIATIEVNKKIHEFLLGDNEKQEIFAMLEVLNSRLKEEGHAPNLDLVLRSVSDEEKEAAVCGHAEELAIAFGLLNTTPGQTLRVGKNMRMCNNCHNVNKLIASIEKREIIVRDSYCIHHFKDGLCSCKAAL